jgi:phosphopantothenoylcysteine decarboxylase/phosphopantothenate--cysteine ligase
MSLIPLDQKKIILGVTGSIAAFKAADLSSKLAQAGALVDIILTESGARFVTPLTFQSLTGREAYTDKELWGTQAHVLHVGLAHQADMLVIAPATANTMAKIVHGIADNLLSLAALAYGTGDVKKPFLVAPAMDGGMYTHPATQENIHILRERGAIIIGPESGHLASGLEAQGRMTETPELLGHIRYLLTRQGPLNGRHVVITAGGTREAIDPVRLLTNRSSGKQGYALAQAALDAGSEVTLISTSTTLPTPTGAQLVSVDSAEKMEKVVLKTCQGCDALIMAAAVADFRPIKIQHDKIKKQDGTPVLELKPTSDILRSVAQQREQNDHPLIVIGFAAETKDLIENAHIKLQAKKLDMIAANDVSAVDSGFGVDTNRVTLIKADGSVQPLPLMSKTEVAERIIAEVQFLLDAS